MAKNRSRRLRKKMHIEEFQEVGFSVAWRFPEGTSGEQVDQIIDDFINEIVSAYEVDSQNIFLLGFSQGTILSTAYALNHPHKIKHVVALSGYVNEELIQKPLEKESFKDLDFFVSHGSVDQVIPVEWARKAPQFLNALSIKNTCFESESLSQAKIISPICSPKAVVWVA